MVVEQSNIDHIMRGLQSTEGVRLHNHRKKLRQRFDIIKKLGQGTYGKVQLGINKETGQEVAIKAIKKCKIETEADLVRIRREIQIMSSVRHPNIIHIYEVFENREKMVLVMEYAAGGELYDFLSERKVLEETEARRIFRQISTAVYYCHKHKICHRDLKLENILLDEHGNAKIADFGLSNVYDDQRLLNSFCGSPLYASPEIVKGTPYHGPEVDCWSLGVLLYTLVYGAMPFDGSNFKRLVKQISQGVYFEPKTPSSASPLIREMLTVNPQKRATIEQICSHWWVNQGFNVSCLDIAEDLANQTPVRLDLLLSLAPPPENPEKLVVTDDQTTTSQDTPARSMSVGSFMELDPNTEQRIRDFVAQEVPSDGNEKTVKRKLEPDASGSSIKKESARKKERIKQSGEQLKEPDDSVKSANDSSVVMDVEASKTVQVDKEEKVEEKDVNASATTEESAKVEEVKPAEEVEKVPTKEEAKPVAEEEKTEKAVEAITKEKPTRKSVKIVKKKVTKDVEEKKKDEGEVTDAKAKVKKKKKEEATPEADKPESKQEVKDKEEVGKEIKRESVTRKSQAKEEKAGTPTEEATTAATPVTAPKLAERRKSKIFETAEKFMSNDPKSPTQEKPKKVFIPGVKVSDFAKAFERKSSLTSTPAVKSSPSRKSVSKETPERKSEERTKESPESKAGNSSQGAEQTESKAVVEGDDEEEEASAEPRKPTEITDEKLKKLKDSARNIISNALVEEERKKIKKQILKPPVPKAKSEEADSKRPLTLQIGNETATVQVHSPENTKYLFDAPPSETSSENKENIEGTNEKKTSKVEITLRSNTLPRGSTSKAEVRLKSPEKAGNFRTEVEQRVGDPHSLFTTQRSEVAFPVSAAQRPTRSMSLEPEVRKPQPVVKERIIPIQLEDGHKEESEARDRVRDLDRAKPYQRTLSQRSASLSRQGTQDSDTEPTPSAPGEAIKKSPREFIIPIAVEGGGYVTPRATSLEPSDTLTSKRGMRPFSRKISLWSDNGSEDESPFSTLQRHPSRDLEEPFRLHRLRSTRPMRSSVDKVDSASGSEEEEEEDDDGFEILTAENLFSTLLSRVRSLTQRLNVESGIRPGFPSSRLMNHFGPSERLLSNFHQPLQTRLSERPEFGRSLSRDIENGCNQRWSRSEISNSDSTRSMPRGHVTPMFVHGPNNGEEVTGSSVQHHYPRDEQLKKPKWSENETESLSESSSRRERTGKTKRASRTKSLLSQSEAEERVLKAAVNEVKSGIPRRTYSRQISDSELIESSPFLSALHRTMSMRTPDPVAKRPERKSIGITEETESDKKVKDFYEILAEKYGITNVKRYDLGPEMKKQEEKVSEQPEELPPIPPKPKKDDAEKCKTPSEKLAAVLNRLENGTKKSKAKVTPPTPVKQEELKTIDKERLAKGTPPTPVKQEELKTIDKERLAGLSPQALELYEKTLALYQKKKDDDGGKNGKSSIPKKVTKNGEGEVKATKKRGETPEKSVLSKYLQGMEGTSKSESDLKTSEEYFNEKKLKHYGSLRSRLTENRKKDDEGVTMRRKSLKDCDELKEERIRRLSRELEAELSKEESKKLEKPRGEKKYVDKAIRSLRESSVGPKDVVSENVLIKRAVSVGDCSPEKSNQPGTVLGLLKKIEPEESRIPVPKNGRPTLRVDVTNDSEKVKTRLEATRRPSYISNSYICRNDVSTLNKSPSSLIGLDDSSSLRSPDSESFDSWSNCSDLGSPDDFYYRASASRHSNFDEMSTESVGERIRRKSFYTRFNERKKPRRSTIVDAPRKDDTRPKPFYKSTDTDKSPYRKTSLDWPKTASSPTYARSNSQSSTFTGYATLSRSFMDSLESSRLGRTGSSDLERALSPVRPFSPTYITRNQN